MPLPNDWREVPLSEVTIPTETWNPRNQPRGLIRYVDVSAVDRDLLAVVGYVEHSPDNAPSRARKIVRQGDTIFATVRPTLRRIALISPSLDGEIVSTAFCVLRPNLTSLDPDFLYFAVQTDEVMAGIASLETGASYPAVRDPDVLDQRIALPSRQEQQLIAQALKTVRGALLLEMRAEGVATNLKRAAMRELFTRGLKGEPQKETEIGLVPESWEVTTLGNVSEIERGRFLHRPRNEPRFYGGTTPFVQTGDVVRSRGRIREFTQTLNADGVAISRVFPAGTILITIAANIGYTGILNFDSACPDSLVAITPHKAVIPEFLEFWLQTQQPEMDRLAPKGTQKNINIQFLLPWPVALPSAAEQKEIVGILDAIDRKIDLHKKKRAVLDELFKALLHKLMTGEIRVTDLDLSALDKQVSAEAA